MAPYNKPKIIENDWHIFCWENLSRNGMQRSDVNLMWSTNPLGKARPQQRGLRTRLLFRDLKIPRRDEPGRLPEVNLLNRACAEEL